MSVQPSEFKRLFTVEEANATLPLVRAICTDMSELSRDLFERRERLAQLMGRRTSTSSSRPNDPYREELEQVEKDLEADKQRLQEYLDELTDLGLQPKNATEGLVDFPSMMGDRVVFLCWKLGEGDVHFWHEIEDGFAGRQPLTAESITGDGSFDGDNFDGGDFDAQSE